MTETAQQEADRIDAAETEELREESEAPREYIQYLGEQPHGTDFLTSHTLPRGDGLWKRAKITVTKDLTWERDPMGPGVGQRGNRMLLPVEDLPEGVAAVLEKTPGYKRVTD